MSGVNRLIKAQYPKDTSALQPALRKGTVDAKQKIALKNSKAKAK